MLIDGIRARGETPAQVRQGESEVLDAVQMPGRHQVHIDRSRDALLTDFGRATLSDRYLMPGEEFQDLFARVASYYGDDAGARAADLRLHVAGCGSCRRRRCCRTAARSAACRSPAS